MDPCSLSRRGNCWDNSPLERFSGNGSAIAYIERTKEAIGDSWDYVGSAITTQGNCT